MKVSMSWLKTYICVDLPAGKIAETLTMAGLEVDSVTDRFGFLDTVRVGKVTALAPHPQSKKLKVCRVELGKREHTVVCGAPNVAEGQLVPVALPGTDLPDGNRIDRSVIRGVASDGMICSQAELGLGEDASGIWVLEHGRPGEGLKSALGLADEVLEIDLTPNRADCLSVIGVAREVGALTGRTVQVPGIEEAKGEERIEAFTSVKVLSPEHCPRYAAAVVVDITVGPSPFWLQDRLRSIGLRPINNVVDITNFVMMEMGQPLHAFDYDRLAENRIVVRAARAGEPFVTLDGKTRLLADDTLMICDGVKPVAIAGVMGGLNSEIDATTRRVLIESAHFDPASIRKTAKRFGMSTDASHRFERGVDPSGVVPALERAAALMVSICGGRRIRGIVDVYPNPHPARQIRLSVSDTQKLLGFSISREEISRLLKTICFDVKEVEADALMVNVPSFRFDVTRPVDLMEEVARLNGYDRIPTRFPAMTHPPGRPSRMISLRGRLKRYMVGAGFSELVTYSFNPAQVDDGLGLEADDPRRRHVHILNPLTEEQSVMRTSLVPGLLWIAKFNLSQQTKTLRCFETGKVFIAEPDEALPRETEMLSGLWTGARQPCLSWHDPQKPCDFYDMKGVVEGLLSAFGVDGVQYRVMDTRANSYYRQGYAALMAIGDKTLGMVGEVAPGVLARSGLSQAVYIFEVDLDQLLVELSETSHMTPSPRYPATDRDITLIVDQGLETASLVTWIQNAGEKWVESIQIIDIFDKDPIPTGKKSVSIRVVYRSHEGTLEDEAVNERHRQLSERLVDAFDAALPG